MLDPPVLLALPELDNWEPRAEHPTDRTSVWFGDAATRSTLLRARQLHPAPAIR